MSNVGITPILVHDYPKTKTEKEVLAINGIGKGTINKLKANGVRFKKN
ncbi:hypothetical protein QP168_03715 [Aerococcus urinae]|uniref:Uncharacterized protein n=1 Tax=Aerococcus mictus TaxID=2976810 RepID=A0A9Q4DCI0_9LACT|nr:MULTISPECIES: hypothetical protein [Aerococcus]MBU5609482.1 hypothetical protein [Aerococcus urinae]MCY3033501.1 hypothetical protein [Aerococcus mictus]MCY3064348.1 hypothetical protein [Aerococcus mictus]MCY3065304.1 hypothetical protein [Aerococcus mictus]MCY3066975.1 hypothetical protein [Aerococcus mictus]